MRAPKPRPREERTGREEAPSASRTRSPLPKSEADRRRWQGATTRNSWRYSEEEQRSQRRRDAAELGDGFRVRDTSVPDLKSVAKVGGGSARLARRDDEE